MLSEFWYPLPQFYAFSVFGYPYLGYQNTRVRGYTKLWDIQITGVTQGLINETYDWEESSPGDESGGLPFARRL